MKWKTMSSAPKDKFIFLAIKNYQCPIICRWYDIAWYATFMDTGARRLHDGLVPYAWAHIPEVPLHD